MQGIGYHVREASETEVVLGTLGTELYLVKGCLEETLFDPIFSDILQGLIEGLLAFLDIF